MKQRFLSSVSLWLKMRIYFARHRKHVSENLGLIIALLAAGFAAWASWEARQARKDAHDDAMRSLKIAQRSYVEVEGHTMQTIVVKNGRTYPQASFEVKVYGNSPAFNVRIHHGCRAGPDHTAIEKISGTRELMQRILADYNQRQYQVLVAGSSDKVETECWTDSTEPSYSGSGLISFGAVSYDDVFGDHHLTSFCYDGPFEALPIQKPLHSPASLSECPVFNEQE